MNDRFVIKSAGDTENNEEEEGEEELGDVVMNEDGTMGIDG